MTWLDPLPDEREAWAQAPLPVPTSGAPRRTLTDLPPGFLDRLLSHYLDYAVGRVRRRWRSVQLYLSDPADLRQQTAQWVLEAATTYDPGVAPFAGYLADLLARRPLDLTRATLGRSLTDAVTRMSRVQAHFLAEQAREPTTREVAAALGVSPAAVVEWNRVLAAAYHRESLAHLPDDEEVALAVAIREGEPWHVRDPADVVAEQEAESMVLRAVLDASLPRTPEDPHVDVLPMVGFLLTTYGDVTKTALAQAGGIPYKRLARRMAALLPQVREALRQSGAS